MDTTTETIAAAIAGDGAKLLAAIPALTSAYQSVQSSLTANQHVDVLQKITDLVAAVTPSVDAAAAAGLIGHADAAHVAEIGEAIATGAGQVTFWKKLEVAVRSWF